MTKKTENHRLTLFTFFILVLSLAIFLYSTYLTPSGKPYEKYPEILYLSNHQLNFDQLKSYFKELSNSKSAVYAFEIMDKANIPYGIDTHLLAHTVGDELYKQKGILGIKFCDDRFRNACSHSLVINFFYEKGEAGFNEIHTACRQNSSPAAFGMCYHGLGHGIFANSGYNLPKTLELCKKAATDLSGPQYKECVGGAIMEQISGGDHDKKTWTNQRSKNLNSEKPLSVCLQGYIIDGEAQKMCLIYLTPYLWEVSGRTSLVVSDQILTKSFEICNQIPTKATEYRKSCFGGFGKEFVSLAKGKDIRTINELTDDEMRTIYNWCLLSSSTDGQKYCIVHAQGSMYWSGTNDKKLPERFCSLAPNTEISHYCYQGLIGAIKSGEKKSVNYLKEFCHEIPQPIQSECSKEFNL